MYISRQRNCLFSLNLQAHREHAKDNATRLPYFVDLGEVQSFTVSHSEFGRLSVITGHLTIAVGQTAVFKYVIDCDCAEQSCEIGVGQLHSRYRESTGTRPRKRPLGIQLWQWSAWQREFSRQKVWWEVDHSLLPGALQVLWPQASRWTGGPWDRPGAVSHTAARWSGPSLEVTVNLFPVLACETWWRPWLSPRVSVHRSPSNWRMRHCHSGNAFNQLQSLHSSFRNRSGLDELSNPGRSGLNCWDIACLYFGSTSVVRAVLRRAIIVNWELSQFVLATTCIPIDPVQRILSRLNEKSGGRRGPGCLAPSLMMAGWELGP